MRGAELAEITGDRAKDIKVVERVICIPRVERAITNQHSCIPSLAEQHDTNHLNNE